MKESIIAKTTQFLRENGIPYSAEKPHQIILVGTPYTLQFHAKHTKEQEYCNMKYSVTVPESFIFIGRDDDDITHYSNFETVISEISKALGLSLLDQAS